MVTKRARLWWSFNGSEAAGCLVTLGMTSLLLLAVLIVLWPFGATTAATGNIVGFGLRETEQGSYPVAYVVADGLQGRVRLYPSDRCAIGDKVDLRIRARPWGKRILRDSVRPLCPSLTGPFLPAESP